MCNARHVIHCESESFSFSVLGPLHLFGLRDSQYGIALFCVTQISSFGALGLSVPISLHHKIIAMGGGGVMRAAAAAKVVGVTAANGGFRGFAPDHPVCAAARAAVRPVYASAMLSASENPAVDGTAVQRPFLEFDDWGFSDGEETPPPRLVFGGAPTLQEAQEATYDLKEAIEK